MQAWSANPVLITAGSNVYNFNDAASNVYGDNQIEVESGVFAIYSGDLYLCENLVHQCLLFLIPYIREYMPIAKIC